MTKNEFENILFEKISKDKDERYTVYQVIACIETCNNLTLEECKVIGKRAWDCWFEVCGNGIKDNLFQSITFEDVISVLCFAYTRKEHPYTLKEIAVLGDNNIRMLILESPLLFKKIYEANPYEN